MAASFVFALPCCFLLLQALASAQNCVIQPVFPNNLPNPNPLVCDGDAGGSQISVFPNTVLFKFLGGVREPILGFPDDIIPRRLKLVVVRRPNGLINSSKSYVLINAKKLTYGAGGQETLDFRKFFNVLQVLVRQFEIGNCPVDSKGQIYPELASVRGSLLSLAAVFNVQDCSGGNVM